MLAPGWTPLDPVDNDRCWQRFEARFGFRAGVDAQAWPAIGEPAPSVTFDLSAVFARDPAGFSAGVAAVDAEVWRALEWCRPDDELIALDWQHPGYRVDVARSTSPHGWPVSPFPDGDYFAFLTRDLAHGTFGHPWEQTLCVLGAALVDTLAATLRTWLPVLRVDGRTVDPR